VAEVNALGRTGIEVVRCPRCASVAMSGEVGDVTPDDASIDAYVEAGAGIDAIAAGIDVVDPGAIRRMLDVGCNYGFGMDLARHLHGWETLGVEPSPAGRRGAAELGLDIRDEYVTDTSELDGPFDLVLASEVLEHVPDPHGFLRTLARQLAPSGVLVLTTPAAEAVVPQNVTELVLIALSPGFHGFLSSEAGLTGMLRDAGFASVSVRRDGGTLRARASLAAGLELERPADESVDRLALEAYYEERTAAAAPGSALENGMATRHLRSAVNRGDFATAEGSAARAVDALRRRHGFDLDDPDSVSAALRAGRAPAWNLVGAAYALGMVELLGRNRPDRAARYFALVLEAIDAWRAFAGLLDGDSANLRGHAARHRALALVRAEPSSALGALAAAARLLDAHDQRMLRLQLFTELVSAGHHDVARDLAHGVAAIAPVAARAADRSERRAGLDALYCLSTHAAGCGDLATAVLWAEAARPAIAAAPVEDDLAVLLEGLAAHEHNLAVMLTPSEPVAGDVPEPPAAPAHAVEVFWVDASGVHLSGWAHQGNEPVTSIAIERAGVAVAQEPTDRPDLLAFWPGVPAVVRSGFRLYLPGTADAPVDLVVTTATRSVRTRLSLPAHPLPSPSLSPDDGRFTELLAASMATAPPGAVLAIGLRGETLGQREALQRAVGDRRLVVADVHDGLGVDVIADAHDLVATFGERAFAVVTSAMVLEHVVAPWLVAEQVNRVLLPGGISAHVAPSAWPEHAQPNDFWRFTGAGLTELFGPRTGFEPVDTGSYGEVRLHPSQAWIDGQWGLATHSTPSASWVVARKVSHLAAGEVRWPYDAAAGLATARRYPLEGLAPAGVLDRFTSQPGSLVPGAHGTETPPTADDPEPTTSGAAHGEVAAPTSSVSVVLPLYDGETYVRTAVQSVVDQTVRPLELVVVDDGSSDGGVAAVRAMDLPFRLVVVTQANQGQSAARNAGIRAATGAFVALIDQDDQWRRDHLSALVPLLEADPELAWVYSDFDELDETGRTVTLSFIRERRVPHPKPTLAACLSGDLMVLPSASVLRKAALEQVGGFDARLRGYEDDDLFVRLFARGWGHAFVPVSTTRYRVHASGSSAGDSFLRSRMLYLGKLIEEFEVDHRINRDLVHDVVLPRFYQTTLNEYTQAIAMHDHQRALGLAGALREISELEGKHGWRRRTGLRMMGHPRRLRWLLLRLERLPRAVRPALNRDLNLHNRTVVREELRSR
jgi:glycosyltransferase involved in cell wall biosynthesis/SAM-dependent methyltransferase